MLHHPYLIVGGGMAAHAAAVAIREVDPHRPIGIVGEEPVGPYRRPPLSKGLWRDESPDSVWLDVRVRGLEVHTGRRVKAIDRVSQVVLDDHGQEYGYDQLLLATGSVPRRLPSGGDRVIHFRTFEDYERLRALADRCATVAVVGGGFIGSEVAAALAMNGLEPTLLFPEETLCARVFPRDAGLRLGALFQARGVKLLPRTTVAAIDDAEGGRLSLRTGDGARLEVDAVVAGIGVRPSVELATTCGLVVDDGVVVDRSLRTNDFHVFAAGDVARFHNPALGVSLRVEHEDAAVTMGAAAGRAMAGVSVSYDHLPFFYSDLFDVGYEAVGLTDARLEVVADWAEPGRRGFLYYLSEGRVRGVLCMGVPRRIDEARALIASAGPFRPSGLIHRLAA